MWLKSYIRIVHSSAKYYVAREQCEGKSLLYFRGKTKHVCIVESYMYSNNTKGTYCCIFMAIKATRTRHNVTLYVRRLSSSWFTMVY
jgi:hypothetical protein